MDGSTLQKFKDALLSRRDQIGKNGKRAEREADAAMELNTPQAELVDIAQAAEQLEREKSLAEQERRELIAVERALAKIASGGFGVCEDCEEEIPSKRLMVLPQARLCARCQAFEERQHGRSRGLSGSISR